VDDVEADAVGLLRAGDHAAVAVRHRLHLIAECEQHPLDRARRPGKAVLLARIEAYSDHPSVLLDVADDTKLAGARADVAPADEVALHRGRRCYWHDRATLRLMAADTAGRLAVRPAHGTMRPMHENTVSNSPPGASYYSGAPAH